MSAEPDSPNVSAKRRQRFTNNKDAHSAGKGDAREETSVHHDREDHDHDREHHDQDREHHDQDREHPDQDREDHDQDREYHGQDREDLHPHDKHRHDKHHRHEEHGREDHHEQASTETNAGAMEKPTDATANVAGPKDKAAQHDALIKKCPVVVKIVVVLITMLVLLAQAASPRFGTRTRKEIFGDTLLSMSNVLIILRSVWDATLRCGSQLKATGLVAVWEVAKAVREWWAAVAAAWTEAAPRMEAWRARTWGSITHFFAAHCWWKKQPSSDKADKSEEQPQGSSCPVVLVHQHLGRWWAARYQKSNATATCPVTNVYHSASAFFGTVASKCGLGKQTNKSGKDEAAGAAGTSGAKEESKSEVSERSYCPAIWLHRKCGRWWPRKQADSAVCHVASVWRNGTAALREFTKKFKFQRKSHGTASTEKVGNAHYGKTMREETTESTSSGSGHSSTTVESAARDEALEQAAYCDLD